MNTTHRATTFLLVGLVSLGAGLVPAFSDVKMPAIFGDHMVLQQSAKLPVWGWATPGEKVTVTVGTQTASTVTGPDGSWRVDLPPIPRDSANAPQTMTVAGTNTLTFQDVLIGDVWIDSGQSNFEFGMYMLEHPAEEVAKANEPLLRLFCVPDTGAITPQKDIGAVPKDSMLGKWEVCTPDTIVKTGPAGGFSAASYYYGRTLQHALGYPVGMVTSVRGGTPCQAWSPLSGLKKYPELAHYVSDYEKAAAAFPQAEAAYPQLLANYQAAKNQWDQEVGTDLARQRDAWTKANADALAKGEKPPPQPQPLRPEPQAPIDPTGGSGTPTTLFNAMIAPLIPYAIKGIIWYQGENNAQPKELAQEYAILFPQMIKEWRLLWGQGDFPFLFVQLAAFGDPAKTPSQDTWPYLRESQAKTLALPNTGMAVVIDIGDPIDMHPKDKLDLGKRLALVAEHVAYGKDVVDSGPMYDSMQVDGNKIILSFKDVDGGLKIAPPPWVAHGGPMPPATELTGFGIAGADKKWYWAKATIEGDKVIVTSDQVPNPVAVRYAWANNPSVDFYNEEDLPAVPFRTDNWN